MRTGLTARVRQAAKELKTFTAADLGHALHVQTRQGFKRVRSVIYELRRSGEIVSLKRGVYEYRPRQPKRTLLDVIWHLVRSHRLFDTDEIERLSGAARVTVQEYLRCLQKLGFLRQVKRGQWQLVQDPGPETPTNIAKSQRLKRLREVKKS